MEIKNNSISKKVTLLLFTIFFLIGVITFKDYGITVDEEFQRSNGFYWLNYVLSFTPLYELNSIVVAKIAQIILRFQRKSSFPSKKLGFYGNSSFRTFPDPCANQWFNGPFFKCHGVFSSGMPILAKRAEFHDS